MAKRAVFVAVGSAVGSAVALGSAAPAAFADSDSLGGATNVTGAACNTADGVSDLADGVVIKGRSPESIRGSDLASGVTGAVRTLCSATNPSAAAQKYATYTTPQNGPQQSAPMMLGGMPVGVPNS
ncbi:hypothetical protein [Streptomyces humicola]|uniref:hypothetical protein n=1 Tax=Streptomyces humicola TaxID=2953240 RepID=UPI00210EF4D3|nr:hypothetical protein [Streptomyces humicola]